MCAKAEKPVDRMFRKRWGVFNHYLYGNPGGGLPGQPEEHDWNAQVDSFDVERLAKNLHDVGAGWYFITVMQGRKFILGPNATYDAIAGTKPGEVCSRRDLVMELADALAKYDIDICLYFTGDGPYKDEEVGTKFGIPPERGHVTETFVRNWSSVLEEYAVRYGNKVKAWWLDGMYRDFLGYNEHLLDYYYKAIKKGNPDALVAFNNGVSTSCRKWYSHSEFTAGEFNYFTFIPESRFIDGAQAFMLIPLGVNVENPKWSAWRSPGAIISHEALKEYVDKVNAAGGVVTIDIYVDDQGDWDPVQKEVISGI